MRPLLPSRRRSARPAQSGMVLIVTLIVLAAMTLAGIALVRSVDTAVMIAGNLAFRQGATIAGDAGVEAARTWAANRADTLILVTADHETGGLKVTRDHGPGKIPDADWSTTGHTATPVPVYAWGAGAERVTGTIDNTGLLKLMIP